MVKTTEKSIKLPPSIWKALQPVLPDQAICACARAWFSHRPEHAVYLRLKDGSERLVCVNAQGDIVCEAYSDTGHGAASCGPPLFAADDIESWSYPEKIRFPRLPYRFKTQTRWKRLAGVEEKASGNHEERS